MAWYDTVVAHVTSLTAATWNAMITYIRSHKSEHITGGIDPIPVATTGATGLCPALNNVSTNYLSGTGVFSDPAIASSAVLKADYNAYTVLAADTNDTPLPITLAASTILGRKATGGIVALSKAEALDILDVDTAVKKEDFSAFSILAADTDDTPAPLTVAASTLVGRKAAGGIVALTKAEALTILNVEDAADVTDTANVNTAGAVMETDYNANTILAATADNTPLPLTVPASTFVGRKATGDISAMSVVEAQTLLGAASGLVAKADFDANTILAANVDDTPLALSVPVSTVVGRKGSGNISAMTPAETKVVLAIDHGTDVTGLTDDDHTIYIKADGSRAHTNYMDITEAAVPGTPSANILRIYVEDYKGFSFLTFKDDTGMVRRVVRDSVFVGKATVGISKGQAVYAVGSSGGVPTLGLAKADSATTMPCIGISVDNISTGNHGRVMQVGLLEGYDTHLLAEGSLLYVSQNTAGLLTVTAPTYPNLRQEIGTVLVSGVGDGQLQIIARSMMNDGIIDHGGLLGKSDDDHPQYSPVDGTRAFTGAVTGLTAALDTSDTKLATTAFVLNQASDDVAHMDGSAAAGTSERYSRHDHIHPTDTTLVAKSLYDAFSILYADTNDIPVALTVGASTFVGRKSSGGIVALTATEARTIINVADGANAYVHPHHSGDVTSVNDGATTIVAGAVTLAKMANVVTDSLLGRASGGTGGVEVIACTAAGRALIDDAAASNQRTTLGLGTMATEASTSYVANALFDEQTILAATTDNTPAALTVAEQRLVGRKTGGNIAALTATEVRTILNVADGSQPGTVTSVTGTEPIISSGGTTPAISISAATTVVAGSMSSADKLKLDGIEAAADVTDATNVAAAGAVMASLITAKGDLITSTDIATPSILPVGADGKVLTAQADGTVAWEDAPGVFGTVIEVLGSTSVTSTGGSSPIIAVKDAGVTLAKMADLEENRVIGRANAAGTGAPQALTAAQAREILNVSDGATANEGTVTAVNATLPITSTGGVSPTIGINLASTLYDGAMSADHWDKLEGIEEAADVTDATNVATAGAIMKTLLTAKGSIITATAASTPVELPVSTDGLVLTCQADGTVAWETAPGASAVVTAVTGAAPITSTGGITPEIGIVAATTSVPGSMSAADKTKLDAIEALADVTDATNVNAAGAVMETDYNAYTILAADTDNVPAPLTVAASTFLGRKATGGIAAMTRAEALAVLSPIAQGGFGAIVYQDASYTYAIDKNGTSLITPVLKSSSYDVTPVIQAAIDYCYTGAGTYGACAGKVFICAGTYYPKSLLTVKKGVAVVCDTGVYNVGIRLTTDIDFCEIKGWASWEEGTITINSTVGTYTHTLFTFDGADASHYTLMNYAKIKNVLLHNQCTNAGGTAIWCKSDTETSSDLTLYHLLISHVNFSGFFTYGLYLSAATGAQQYKAGGKQCNFEYLVFDRVTNPIYNARPGTYGVWDSCIFEHILIQPSLVAPFTVNGITWNGNACRFFDMHIADWTADLGYKILLTAKSTYNYFDMELTTAKTYISDLGTANYLHYPKAQGRTSIADGGTIAHGLGTTPTWAVVTPITAGEFATVTTMDATNLTVAIKKHDNSAGTTQYVNWMCGL